jgi:putative Mg2+ transporter-C (MgtC) family protein
MTSSLFIPDTMSWAGIAIRMAAASILPLLIGIERYLRRKPIDFRPFVIISISACGLAVGAMEMLAAAHDPQFRVDPSRIFAGVITGIGFLGAGAMFRHGTFVQGAASAAAIWAAGAIGLLCGTGEIWLAATVTGIILLLLILSDPFTAKWDAEADESEGPPASE